MPQRTELSQFLDELHDDVQARVPDGVDTDSAVVGAFTEYVAEELAEYGAVENLIPCLLDENTGKVKSLDLAGSDLGGCIPPSIVELSALEELLLHDNKLEGTLPDLSRMESLTLMDVSDNPDLFCDEKITNAVNNRKIALQKSSRLYGSI